MPFPVQVNICSVYMHSVCLLRVFYLSNNFGVFCSICLFGGEPENRTQAVVWSFGIIAALAIGRIILGPIPNVQPVTIGLLLVGATYGVRKGIGIAILVTILSNIFLGLECGHYSKQSWSIVAVGGYMAANQFIKDEKLMIGRLMIAGFIAAFVFDYIVSLSVLIADPSLGVLIAYLITGLPFDLLHAAGNIVIAITLGPSMHNMLTRSLSPTNLTIRSSSNESRVE